MAFQVLLPRNSSNHVQTSKKETLSDFPATLDNTPKQLINSSFARHLQTSSPLYGSSRLSNKLRFDDSGPPKACLQPCNSDTNKENVQNQQSSSSTEFVAAGSGSKNLQLATSADDLDESVEEEWHVKLASNSVVKNIMDNTQQTLITNVLD